MSSRVLKIVLLVLVVYGIFTYFLLQYYQGDLSCVVHAGSSYANPAQTPKELCLKDKGDGYDGQFNYRFALNPFSNQPVSNGISIDQPSYRYQRILYPFLVWVLSGGNRDLVPFLLVALNLLAVCALTGLCAAYALGLQRSSYWSLLLGLYLGFLISYALDLNHTLEILLLFLALWLARKKDAWASLCLCAAVLTRETAVVLAAAILIMAFWQRWRGWFVYLAPLAVFALWQIFVRWFWKDVPNLIAGESLVLPLAGFLSALRTLWLAGDTVGIGLYALVLALGIGVLTVLRRSPAPGYFKLGWLLYAGLALMMSVDVWVKFNGYLRGLSEWYFLGVLIVLPLLPAQKVSPCPTGDHIQKNTQPIR